MDDELFSVGWLIPGDYDMEIVESWPDGTPKKIKIVDGPQAEYLVEIYSP